MIYKIDDFSIDIDVGDEIKIYSMIKPKHSILEVGNTYKIYYVENTGINIWAYLEEDKKCPFSLNKKENTYKIIKQNKNLKHLIKNIIKNNGKENKNNSSSNNS